MHNFFSFQFEINGIKFNAEAVAFLNNYTMGYHVRTGDLIFDIFPSEAMDGYIAWVDENGDTMPLLQVVGDAIADFEMNS